jgi:hypothetical protein
MTTCPCGCNQLVKPKRTYASKGCYLRANKGIARELGKEGAKTGHVVRGEAIAEKFMHLPKPAAILAAVQWAWKVRRQRKYRARKASNATTETGAYDLNAVGRRHEALKGRLGMR